VIRGVNFGNAISSTSPAPIGNFARGHVELTGKDKLYASGAVSGAPFDLQRHNPKVNQKTPRWKCTSSSSGACWSNENPCCRFWFTRHRQLRPQRITRRPQAWADLSNEEAALELPFFVYHLKTKGDGKFPKAWVFETGTDQTFRRLPSESIAAPVSGSL
jgi:hypothetical protein